MKKLSLFLALMLICVPAHAGEWTHEHSIIDFSKLLSSHVNPFIVSDGSAVEARNLRSNVKFGELTKRKAMDTYGACGSFKVTGLHRYYKKNGDQLTICSGDTELKGDLNNNKTFVTLRDELTDGRRWSFATFKNNMIGVNGVDANQKYDGHTLTTANTDGARTVNVLTADLGAPFAELDTGTDLDASSWYQYSMAYTDGSSTWYSTTRSNPILTGAAVYNIALTDVPLGPAGTTERYVYRTDGNASRAAVEADTTLKLVGTISDNSTQELADTTADGSVDTPLWTTVSAQSDITPPIGKFILIHKERVFLGNNPSYNSDIYWSYPFRADIFNAADYEPIREDDGDVITCLKNQSGVVVICKTNTIMKMITLSEDEDQWQVLGPYSHVGCQAPYSSANTPKGIACLAKEGIYIFDGSSSQLISDVVTTDVADVLWTSRDEVAGAYFKNEYQMAYTSAESGEGENNRVLVLDMSRDSYVIDDKNINIFEVFDSGTDEGTLYSGSSLTDGAILAHTETVGNLIYKTKTDFESGTYDDTDVFGDEQDPSLQLAWNKTFADVVVQYDSALYTDSIWARPDTDGTWTSPIIEVNATNYDKLYWNEVLTASGTITFAIKSAATEGGIPGASWSSEFSESSGSDISGETANTYAQLRATLGTSDITKTPEIIRLNNFSIKMVYAKEGSSAETIIPTIYETGIMDFGIPDRRKQLWEVIIYYEGEEGSFDFLITDVEGEVSKSFTVDLTIDPDDDTTDQYTGTVLGKKYTHVFEYDGTVPIANLFKYRISDDGITDWAIQKIKTRFSVEAVID